MRRDYLDSCQCCSNLPAIIEYDARGIELGFMCEECREKKRSKFRPEVLNDPNYWTDEPIDKD